MPRKLLDVDARTRDVRDSLRHQNVREELVQRMSYSPMSPREAAEGVPIPMTRVAGSTTTPRLGQRGTGRAHATSFMRIEDGAYVDIDRVALDVTTRHELEHLLQERQLQTMGAPGGPLAHLVGRGNMVTSEGVDYLEREVYEREVDHLLRIRQTALEQLNRGGGDPVIADKARSAYEESRRQLEMTRRALQDLETAAEQRAQRQVAEQRARAAVDLAAETAKDVPTAPRDG